MMCINAKNDNGQKSVAREKVFVGQKRYFVEPKLHFSRCLYIHNSIKQIFEVHKNLFMKKDLIKSRWKTFRTSLLLATLALGTGDASAQIILATRQDSVLLNVGWVHLNCAHIGYCGRGGSTGTDGGNPQGKSTIAPPPPGYPCATPFNLMGISYDHASTTFAPPYGSEGNSTGGGGFLISDLTHPPINVTMPASETWYDIIIGNSLTTGNYKAGITYTRGGNIYLDIYDVASPGTSLTVTYNSTYMISHSGTANLSHIDIIADGTSTTAAFANANKFAITWDDGHGINVYYASLDFPTIPGTTISGFEPMGTLPDVAAIERGSSSSHQDYALLTYYIGSQLFERDVNLTTGAVSPSVFLDMQPFQELPRIDAVDDYNVNGGATFTKWQITAFDGADVKTYNNNSYPAGLNMTSTLSGSGDQPCVAAGPGNNYSVAFYNSSVQKILTQKFDQGTGLLTSPNFYAVSFSGAAGANPGVSATCNTRQYLLTCWLKNNAVINYKFTADPYAFKHPVENVGQIALQNLELYPNPTNGSFTVKGDYNTGDQYNITDIQGKVIMSGAMQTSNQQLDLGHLSAGTYFFNLKSDKGTTVTKLVKM